MGAMLSCLCCVRELCAIKTSVDGRVRVILELLDVDALSNACDDHDEEQHRVD